MGKGQSVYFSFLSGQQVLQLASLGNEAGPHPCPPSPPLDFRTCWLILARLELGGCLRGVLLPRFLGSGDSQVADSPANKPCRGDAGGGGSATPGHNVPSSSVANGCSALVLYIPVSVSVSKENQVEMAKYQSAQRAPRRHGEGGRDARQSPLPAMHPAKPLRTCPPRGTAGHRGSTEARQPVPPPRAQHPLCLTQYFSLQVRRLNSQPASL